jgi:hypothetical protein
LESCDEPEGLEQVDPSGDRVILAEGEATGHYHAASASDAVLLAKGTERFLRVVRPTMLKHDEHREIKLPAGTFRVVRQREYSPGEIRQVSD